MAIDAEMWTRLLAKLIVETRDRKVRWQMLHLERGEPVGFFSIVGGKMDTYLSDFNGQAFRFDYVRIPPVGSATENASRYKLSISKSDGSVLRQVPVSSGLADLHQAIEDQLAGIDEFVDKYLNE